MTNAGQLSASENYLAVCPDDQIVQCSLTDDFRHIAPMAPSEARVTHDGHYRQVPLKIFHVLLYSQTDLK